MLECIDMRTTIELSEQTYTQLRATAAERGMRGFSAIVEEALKRLFARGGGDETVAAIIEAEGAWTTADVEEWEQVSREAWATWPSDPYSTPTS